MPSSPRSRPKLRLRVEKDEAVVGKQAAETKAIADDGSGRFRRGNASVQERSQSFRRFREEGPSKRFDIKAYASPPDAVKMVMEAILILFGRPTDWKLEIGQRFVG